MPSLSLVRAATPQPTMRPSSNARARQRRLAARERIHNRVVHAIDTPQLLRDPLEHPTSALRSTFGVARLLVIAALLHGLMLAIVFLGNEAIGSARVNVRPERVKVRIVETRA